ncbi:MAG: HAMP domain-containing sensor histidine kinase, partial [Chloroflexota bacterium]
SDLTIPLAPGALSVESPMFENVQFGDTELRVLTRPVLLPNGVVVVSVQVGASLQTVNESVDRLLTILMVSMGLAIIGSVVVGLLLADRALKPIDDIIQAAARITETDDLTTRLDWRGPMDELGRLTSVFNHMMDRLEHLFGVQQRFVADVSHELRTPLTAIRGNLDLAERYGTDEVTMEAISSEVGRMSRMVDDLLLLARADYGGMKLDLGPLDLDTVVSDAFREAKAIVRARGDELYVEVGRFEPVRINGNADRIKQLLLNLVGNAVKFTPEGGTIKLSLSAEGDYAVMRVADTGIGIAEEDIPHVFDRFYQAESSRANSEKDVGTGLGLSICKWIAEAHGGHIKVESKLRRGTTFTIAVPRMEYTAPTRTRMQIT